MQMTVAMRGAMGCIGIHGVKKENAVDCSHQQNRPYPGQTGQHDQSSLANTGSWVITPPSRQIKRHNNDAEEPAN